MCRAVICIGSSSKRLPAMLNQVHDCCPKTCTCCQIMLCSTHRKATLSKCASKTAQTQLGSSPSCWADMAFCGVKIAFCWADTAFCWADTAFCWAANAFCWAENAFCWADTAFCWAGTAFYWAGTAFCWVDAACLSLCLILAAPQNLRVD